MGNELTTVSTNILIDEHTIHILGKTSKNAVNPFENTCILEMFIRKKKNRLMLKNVN